MCPDPPAGSTMAEVLGSARRLTLSIESELVPSPVSCDVLLPPSHHTAAGLPLVLALHGGDGGIGFIDIIEAAIGPLWAQGALRDLIVLAPSSGRSFWVDWRDGSQRWETWLRRELLPRARSEFDAATAPESTLLFGLSMGGLGALRLAFKTPEQFGAVAAMEPGIEPALAWEEITEEHRAYRPLSLLTQFFGDPIDTGYWAANQPPAIAVANAAAIRDSGVQIRFECGDEDSLRLYEGAEFLHRLLQDLGVLHDYHLVRGADHVGPSLIRRTAESFGFLSWALDAPTPDQQRDDLLANLEALRDLLQQARSPSRP
ncbi:MAG: esterase [Acidobacteria bacterium]|nr:MAG: esterase [Acidobacteriota bacterium]